MKKSVLFVTEKWCDGNPALGLTNSFHNTFNTFSKTQNDYYYNTIHLDESGVVYGKHIDEVLPSYCDNNKVDIIFFCLLGGSPLNPSLDTYLRLKQKGIFLSFIWPDTGPGWGIQTIAEFGDIPDQNVSWDFPVSPFHEKYKETKKDNHLFLWTPEDDSLFFDCQKDINVSFVGSTAKYRDRYEYLTYLLSKKSDILVSGGQRENKLTPEEYASFIRRSKIGINLSLSQTTVFHQLKGRTLEYISSNCLLLESGNPATRSFFTPGEDYVEFDTPQDLLEKIDHYLNNEDERLKIAKTGYDKFKSQYTAAHYWQRVMEKIKL
jgi:glycosyltransferase involved in cell wall biosynthesis